MAIDYLGKKAAQDRLHFRGALKEQSNRRCQKLYFEKKKKSFKKKAISLISEPGTYF
jgi:hypothetical protein